MKHTTIRELFIGVLVILTQTAEADVDYNHVCGHGLNPGQLGTRYCHFELETNIEMVILFLCLDHLV